MTTQKQNKQPIAGLIVFGLLVVLIVVAYLLWPAISARYIQPFQESGTSYSTSEVGEKSGTVSTFASETDTRDTTPVQSVKSEADLNLQMGRICSLRDVITVMAFTFVLIAVVTMWVIHTIRTRRDPTRKWMK